MDFESHYWNQRTCLNGHVITNFAENEPQQLFCESCGKSTITSCPACNGPLRGANADRTGFAREADAYCLHCGTALPWTQAHLDAVNEIAHFIDTFDDNDRTTLKEILPDLVASAGTPRTQIGIVKMKDLLAKGTSVFAESARKILVDVMSEAARKALFPWEVTARYRYITGRAAAWPHSLLSSKPLPQHTSANGRCQLTSYSRP